ncbi:hypothetical protein [Roseisolibacter sp. H3M3-2]|uniref:hypothetical protein n=1 Tax=Roseisolibacter sp. H3M3-2 TaxID=3031323 RepID=UPI0023D9FC54|nr:hypothetical protein [Roseisolibacter sp. H3M3-2]MDF1503723.1 hypothetical protein [Roseisolibacter sp. H3M3-2]
MSIASSPLPLAQRTALDALDAQRAAYRRYARLVEAQQQALGAGDGDRAVAATDVLSLGHDELREGAAALPPLVQEARAGAGTDVRAELDRRVDALLREAQAAEVALRNLATQMEAWRDAYGRQLGELGVQPGSEDRGAGAGGYGPRGAGAPRTAGAVP